MISTRSRLSALATVFLAAHLLFLPPTLEDVDSVNFALGVRDFDVARHQPHPPGYPIFIALAKISTTALRTVGVAAPEARGLAIWSAIAGAAAIPLLFLFFVALGDGRRAWWGTLVVACTPLFWFAALRPLSDATGLALALAAQALLASVTTGRSAGVALAFGAFLAALAIGVRSQTFLLTLPLLLWALVLPGTAIPARQRVLALGAAVAGGVLWAGPLIVASGGVGSYMAALGSQAGEDFSGVVILWTVRSARVAAQALVFTLLWPWGAPWLGAMVIGAAAIGGLLLLWRSPRTAVLLAVAFVPYAVFHLLFHEIVTVRYALPLVVPVAYLAVVALDAGSWRPSDERASDRWSGGLLPVGACALAVAGLALSARPTWTYAHDGSPTFRAFADLGSKLPGAGDRIPIAMHAFARRAAEWEAPRLGAHVLTPPHGIEWLAAVKTLRLSPSIAFVADPRRTDLALFDGHALRLLGSYRWGFPEQPFVGGARPGNTDVYAIESPAWMLDRGWALTAEVGGVTERDGSGPHRQPSVAWVRGRSDATLLVIGGRHLGGPGDPGAEITASAGGHVVDRWTAQPGFFTRRIELPAGALATADAFSPLSITSHAADGSSREVRVSLEQFDLQGAAIPMFAFEEGWQEPEYNPMTAVAWRWMSDRAVLWVRPVDRDVTLELSGESPLRYYDSAPLVRVLVGEAVVGEFRPESDFLWQMTLPAAALAASGGRVAIASDKHFVPGERNGSPDRRRLAIRTYSVKVH